MRLVELKLRGFRNLRDAAVSLPAEGVALVGANAQGKTNFLEAVYYLETFRSFRGAADRELVRFGEDFFRVEGGVEVDEGERRFPGERARRTVAAAWQRDGTRKKVTLDGVEPERLGDGIGQVGVVLFSPADLALVDGGPAERRRFLDIVLSLNDPAYLPALQRYRKVLSQRNAALKEERSGQAAAAWNDLLVREGARVTNLRLAWLRESAPDFARLVEEISDGEIATFHPEPGIPGLLSSPDGGRSGTPTEADVRDRFGAALLESRERERRRATTVVGPHRDEVRIRLGARGAASRELRSYGSGGQRRSVALSLRLLEADTIRRKRGREPILLLDDVFAELDEDRSARLLDLLDRTAVGQVLLTSPGAEGIPFRSEGLARWSIHEGEIKRSGHRGVR